MIYGSSRRWLPPRPMFGWVPTSPVRSNPDREPAILKPPEDLVHAVVDVLKKIAAQEGMRPRGGKIERFSPYPPLKIPKGAIYFASGSNHPGEIQGFADLGLGIGTVVQECMSFVRPNTIRPCEQALYQLLYMGRRTPPIFVDSGAFSEFKAELAGGRGAAEAKLTPAKWDLIFNFYERVTERLAPRRRVGPNVWHGTEVYLVAPDKIADQQETLRRMERYAGRVSALRRKGATILAPIQKGTLGTQEEFYDRVVEVLGRDVIAALPMKQGATTQQELERFLRARGSKLRGLHLLGMGPRSNKAPQVLGAIKRITPDLPLSMDSVLAKAAVGWGRGDVFDPQVFTYAQQIAGLMLEEELQDLRGLESLKVWTDQHGWTNFDKTEEIGFPNDWLTPRQRRELAEELGATFGGLTKEEHRLLLEDPQAFLYSPFRGPYGRPGEPPPVAEDGQSQWIDLEWVYQILSARWEEMVRAATEGNLAAERKRYGIHYAFAQAVAGAGTFPPDMARAAQQLFMFGVEPPALVSGSRAADSARAIAQLFMFASTPRRRR